MQKEPVRRSGDGGSDYKSKWQFFNQMMFVKDSLMPSCLSGNLVTAEEQNIQSPIFEETNDDGHCIESDIDVMGTSSITDVLSPSAESTKHSLSMPKSKKKKRRADEDDTHTFLELEKQKIAILQRAQERETKTNDDPDAQFLLSFLPYIKEFDPLEKLEVRTQIQNVVLNAYRMKKNVHQNNYQPYLLPSSTAAFPFTTNESSQWVLPNNTTTTRSNSIDQNVPITSSLRNNQNSELMLPVNNQTTELMLPVNSQDPYNHILPEPF